MKLSLCMNDFSWAGGSPSFKRGFVEFSVETYEIEYFSKFS